MSSSYPSFPADPVWDQYVTSLSCIIQGDLPPDLQHSSRFLPPGVTQNYAHSQNHKPLAQLRIYLWAKHAPTLQVCRGGLQQTNSTDRHYHLQTAILPLSQPTWLQSKQGITHTAIGLGYPGTSKGPHIALASENACLARRLTHITHTLTKYMKYYKENRLP